MQNIKVKVKVVESAYELESALRIRHVVFCKEQGIPDSYDDDGLDDSATHVLAVEGDDCIGTGRLVISDQKAVLSRIAVLKKYRGHGIAQRIVGELEYHASKSGAKSFELLPHEYLEGFYKKLGYMKDQSFHHEIVGYNLIRMYK